jgi:hypothetical protein
MMDDIVMNELRPSEQKPGRWCIGERELQDGDLIEIFHDDRWHVARYEYRLPLKEYQLKIDGKTTRIEPGTRARLFTH